MRHMSGQAAPLPALDRGCALRPKRQAAGCSVPPFTLRNVPRLVVWNRWRIEKADMIIVNLWQRALFWGRSLLPVSEPATAGW